MGTSFTVQLRKGGSLTLPAKLRKKYGIAEGDVLTLIDLGDGNLMMTPHLLQVEHFGDRVAQMVEEEGVSYEDLLQTLDEERQRYYQERYSRD